MADFTDTVYVNLTPALQGDTDISTVDLFVTDQLSAPRYYQRIYDSGLAQYVYYTTDDAPDVAPAPGDTVPNHTGALVSATHEIIDVL